MPILGINSTDSNSAYRSEKSRRMVMHQYPQGKAPLMYLLSLMDDKETDKSEFGWWEDRDTCVKSVTATSGSLNGGGAGPFTNAALDTSAAAAGWTFTANTEYGIFVADATQFRVYDTVWIKDVPNAAASANLQLRGVVTAVISSGNKIKVRAIETVASVTNDTDGNALNIYYTGSSAMEGGRSVDGAFSYPIEVSNYTQIFRQTIGPFTGSAIKEGMRYDSNGVYHEQFHKSCVRYMKGMEINAFRGRRAKRLTTNSDGSSVPERFSGGFEYFLNQWEIGNTGNGGLADYRPGGSDVSASAWATTDEKRIIPVNGSLTMDQLDMLIERAFRYTNDTTFEKLLLCGNGFMTVFTKLIKDSSYKVIDLNEKEETLGMDVSRIKTPFGTLVMKTHPLFNENATQRNDAWILDMCDVVYHPMCDRDMVVLENRQATDFDGIKDEILGEGGLEIAYPERHMFIQNVTGITV